MEYFHEGASQAPEFSRKEGIRWDRKGRLIRSRGDLRREGTTAKTMGHRLRGTFPDAIIKTHPQPRKK